MHQVRLAHAHAAVKEQWVVGFGGLLGHGARCGVRKFVGLADHEAIEGIAQVELVVVVLEIEPGLFGGRRGGSRCSLFFRADVMDFQVGRAELVKNGFDDLAIGAREHLAEDGAGDLNV